MLRSILPCLLSTLVIGHDFDWETQTPHVPDRQLLQIETIAAFVGTVSAGASMASGFGWYGGKIAFTNEICKELDWNGIQVNRHGHDSTPCRDIAIGKQECCVWAGYLEVGAEGMVQYGIGYDTGKAINIYYRMSAGTFDANRLDFFFSDIVSDPNDLYHNFWSWDMVADTDATWHHEWFYHGHYVGHGTHKKVQFPELNIEVEGSIGGGNNPTIVLDIQTIDKNHNGGTCSGSSSAKAAPAAVDGDGNELEVVEMPAMDDGNKVEAIEDFRPLKPKSEYPPDAFKDKPQPVANPEQPPVNPGQPVVNPGKPVANPVRPQFYEPSYNTDARDFSSIIEKMVYVLLFMAAIICVLVCYICGAHFVRVRGGSKVRGPQYGKVVLGVDDSEDERLNNAL